MAGGASLLFFDFITLLILLLPLAHSLDANTATAAAIGRRYGFFNHSFSSFSDIVNNTDIVLLKDASYSQGALQLTPDSINKPSYLINKTGRALLTTPFRLWNWNDGGGVNSSANAKYVASFNTSFVVNIYRINNTTKPGEGLTFLIAPTLDSPPPGSEGGYLGLTNASLDGDPRNNFIAIELDTAKQSYDPNDNHVGLDINGVNSTLTGNLTVEISPVITKNYTVWVDYDGGGRRIWVYMAVAGEDKPTSTPVLEAPLDLSDHLLQTSYFGFSGSTSDEYELNCVLSWELSVEILPGGKDMSEWKLGLAIGVPAAAAAVAGLMICWWYLQKKKRKKMSMENSTALVAGKLRGLMGMPREFEFKEIQKATKNFGEEMKLGQGGFGVVYRGVLPASAPEEKEEEVAVKKFSGGTSGMDSFVKELTIINRLRHKHLVRLVGWCYENGVLLLVYDYMPNGSLDQYLYGDPPEKPLLSWDRRYNTLAGVASALHYLHYEYDQWVVHRDLKASNIMLDASFEARLGDFGLARALETDKTSYAEPELDGVPGTLGYVAPECFHTGKATRESDVYGFGAVIFEIVCGRRPRSDIDGFQFLCDWVWKLHREDRILAAVDERLAESFDSEEAARLLLLGLACSHPIPGDRPKTPAIIQIISKTVPPPEVPPFKPRFMWPAMETTDDEEGNGYAASRLTSLSLTSSAYTSSEAWSSRYVSRDGPM